MLHTLDRQFEGQSLQRHPHLLHFLRILFGELQYGETAILKVNHQAFLGQHE